MGQRNEWSDEAESLVAMGRWSAAIASYEKALAVGHSEYRLHLNYAVALQQVCRFRDQRDQLSMALQHWPESLEALNHLAVAQIKLSDPCAAERTCRLILAKECDHLAAWRNLGIALSYQGRVLEAIEAMQRSVEIAPSDSSARDNLLLALNYIATDGLELASVHRLLCADLPSAPRKDLPGTTGRRIRVGYVSGDFRSHSVSFFMAGIVGTHDRQCFEVFCYSTTNSPDRRTEDFRYLADHFVDLSTHSDIEAAGRIDADAVDILVDLGGHTSGNRLGIFALRPAPIQASYLGYPATTGCPFIDFRLVDALTDPADSSAFSTEDLVRLPAPFLCYTPHSTFPATSPLPAFANGHITYGSFNHSSKISEETLDLWSRVLIENPASRMVIKSREFSDETICDQFRRRFAQRGIDSPRLTFLGLIENPQEHLAAYSRIDVALDTYPYNGTTTTCEALWMGVPVITLVGTLHAARVGYSILNSVGLDGLAVTSPDNFVAIATAFPEDWSQLANLRARLQKMVLKSPLCDPRRLTRGMEDAYRIMLSTPKEMH